MKKLTSLLLAFALAFGLTGVGFAAGEATRGDVRDAFPKVTFIGDPDGSMRWNDLITRAEVATLLARAEKLADVDANYFPDVTADKWYYGAVNAVRKAGLFIGHDTGLFGPDEWMTMEQVAIVLSRYAPDTTVKSEIATLKNISVEHRNDLTIYTIKSDSTPYTLEKSVTVKEDEKFVVDGTLIIPAGVTLTVTKNAEVDINNRLEVYGKLVIDSEYNEDARGRDQVDCYYDRIFIAKGGVISITGFVRNSFMVKLRSIPKSRFLGEVVIEKTAKIVGLTNTETAVLDGTITLAWTNFIDQNSKDYFTATLKGTYELKKDYTEFRSGWLGAVYFVIDGTIISPDANTLRDWYNALTGGDEYTAIKAVGTSSKVIVKNNGKGDDGKVMYYEKYNDHSYSIVEVEFRGAPTNREARVTYDKITPKPAMFD